MSRSPVAAEAKDLGRGRERSGAWPILKNPADVRQLGIVLAYHGLLWGMYLVPQMRSIALLVVACLLSFLNVIVAHNHLHQGIFHSRRLNMGLRYVLSFGALYPITTNVPAHNLVHHHFSDDGAWDWADSRYVKFRWNLLNLLHFPNRVGTVGIMGTERWMRGFGRADLRRQHLGEKWFSLGLTALLLVRDFWPALFFIVIPQLWGARGILRLNLLQHDACNIDTEWNHSRNFVGSIFNWFMCNNGYHTIHHNRSGLHWTDLPAWHDKEVKPRMHPSLDEPSMVWYLLKTYLLSVRRPEPLPELAQMEARAPGANLGSREERARAAEQRAAEEAAA
jgi:fatty acid desaturase